MGCAAVGGGELGEEGVTVLLDDGGGGVGGFEVSGLLSACQSVREEKSNQ